MAAITGNPDMNGDSAPRKKSKAPIIIILVLFFLILGAAAAIFGLNVFNIRDGYILPTVRNIPIVGNLVPEMGQTVYINGEAVEIPVAADTSELEAIIATLTAELSETQAALSQAEALNAQFSETVSVLQTYRDLITDYRQSRQEFDEMIAMGDPAGFAAFYESVDPENAARLFSQITAQQQFDRAFRNFAATYSAMGADAAELFSIMLTTQPETLINILQTFNTAQRATILTEMDPTEAAIITQLMQPDAVMADILPPITVLDGALPPPTIPVIEAPVVPPVEPPVEE
ncbi:MAG: hypothetical protein FWG64_13785 [Firmicutes bacterium]|nr:hypothetical protein [Bacillota bacterium]